MELSSVVDLFLADPALTARVVVAWNTPLYSRGEPTADIRDGVLRPGLNEVSRNGQIVALTDRRKYPTHLYSVTAGHFRERSLHSAFALAEISGRAASAYPAGMMHLVGIWVMCRIFPAGHLSISGRELALQARLEQLRWWAFCAEAGAAALAQWGFAPVMCAAVGRQ